MLPTHCCKSFILLLTYVVCALKFLTSKPGYFPGSIALLLSKSITSPGNTENSCSRNGGHLWVNPGNMEPNTDRESETAITVIQTSVHFWRKEWRKKDVGMKREGRREDTSFLGTGKEGMGYRRKGGSEWKGGKEVREGGREGKNFVSF